MESSRRVVHLNLLKSLRSSGSLLLLLLLVIEWLETVGEILEDHWLLVGNTGSE